MTIEIKTYIKIINGIAASFKRMIRKTDRIIKIYRVWFSAQEIDVNLRANIGRRETIKKELKSATATRKYTWLPAASRESVRR